MAKPKNDMSPEETATERVPAPATYAPEILPRQMQVERIGNYTSGVTKEWPKVRGGICDKCGVLDPNTPSQYQYKLCGHYRGQTLACSYCPVSKDIDDVNYHSTLRVLEHPDRPNTLIVHCDSYDCLKKHEDKWQRSSN